MNQTSVESNAGPLIPKSSGPADITSLWTHATTFSKTHGPRALKSVFTLSVLGFGLWTALRTTVLPISSEASVAARVVVVRAPIDGVLGSQTFTIGDVVAAGESLGTLTNSRADDTSVRELELKLKLSEAEIAALTTSIEQLDEQGKALAGDTAAYQAQRGAQLNLERAEAQAKLDALQAEAKEAVERFAREDKMSEEGVSSLSSRSSAERDSLVAQQRVVAAEQSLESIKLRSAAAARGVNVEAGGGADRPYSRQRLDQVRLELVQWRRQLDELVRSRETLRSRLTEAQARLKEMSAAKLSIEGRSRVWQTLAPVGGFVSKGTPIVSTLDCGSIGIVAVVGSRLFDRLGVGSPAEFKKSSTGEVFQGRVAQLIAGDVPMGDGLVAPGLKLEPGQRRVVVSLETNSSLAKGCRVGQSGEVHFP